MKKLFVYLLILLAGLSLTNARVWADSSVSIDTPKEAEEPKQDSDFKDSPAAVSVSDLEALNNRISAIEKSNVKVSALLQFWYTHDSYATYTPANIHDYNSAKNQWDGFSFKRGEISVSSDIGSSPKVIWLAKLDPTQASFNGLGLTAPTTLIYPGSAVGAASVGNINPFTIVKDLYIKVAYSPFAALIVGQNKFAQELEGRWASNDADFNNLSNLSNSFGNKRDIGVQLAGTGIPFGDLPLQGEYVLSVIQGSGQSTADNNVDKDLAGRVGFTFDKNLFLGASGYDGWEVNGSRWDIGAEGRWIYNGFKLQAEFITGNLNTNDNSAANNSVWTPSIASVPTTKKFLALPTVPRQINPTAYYLTASYRYQDLRLGARWDGYNFNQWKGSTLDQELDTLTVGLDFFQNKDSLKFSANFEDHLLDGVEAYQIYTIQTQLSI